MHLSTSRVSICVSQDIVPGLLVDDAAACEAECDAVAACNAASFTAELHRTGKNCFLRTLVDACEAPANATATLNAVLSLKCEVSAIVPAVVAASPMEAFAPAGADEDGTGDDDGTSDGIGATTAGSTSREAAAAVSAADDADVTDANSAPPALVASLLTTLVAFSFYIAIG